MPKTKIRNRRSFTADNRDESIRHWIFHSVNVIHICRHGGTPDIGMGIARSVLPVMVKVAHDRLCDRRYGHTTQQQIEDLHSCEILSELQTQDLLDALAKLGEHANGRHIGAVVIACDLLAKVIKSDRFKAADKRTEPAKKATDRRPALLRWASAAGGLFTFGS